MIHRLAWVCGLILLTATPSGGQVIRFTQAVPSASTIPATCVSQSFVYLTTGAVGLYYCVYTNTWVYYDNVAVGSASGDMMKSENLSGLANYTTARSNLGLGTLATQSGTFSGASSGTNSGDQTITLTGNVTGSGTGSFATTITDGAVTLAKQANMATASLVYRKTAGSGVPEVNTLATLKTDLALVKADVGLGNVENTALSTWAGSPNLTTFATSANFTPATGNIGYATGNGGAVTQATSKATGVTLNANTTAITMNAAALVAAATVSFTITNSKIAALDQVICTHQSTGTSAAYTINAFPAVGSAVVSVRNNTAGSLSEAIVVRCSVYKAVSS